ncbi:MAG: hypothetical protein ACXVCP_15605 [Bdellovibrio sp.]
MKLSFFKKLIVMNAILFTFLNQAQAGLLRTLLDCGDFTVDKNGSAVQSSFSWQGVGSQGQSTREWAQCFPNNQCLISSNLSSDKTTVEVKMLVKYLSTYVVATLPADFSNGQTVSISYQVFKDQPVSVKSNLNCLVNDADSVRAFFKMDQNR